MSVEAVTTQWNNYAARMIDTLSAINVKPDGVIMDSHEAGAQNWTPGFEQEFLRRKGPSLTSIWEASPPKELTVLLLQLPPGQTIVSAIAWLNDSKNVQTVVM